MPEHTDGKNRRILVIDDNRSIHDDFRKILCPATRMNAASDAAEAALFGEPLRASGQVQFAVDSAYQGEEGLLKVKDAAGAGRPYAMAFVDVRMPPGSDGIETTRKLWAVDPDLQVVLCTAYSDYSWGEMSEILGHRDALLILKKPFDNMETLQLAHALTEKWWLLQQARRKMEELEILVAGRTRALQRSNESLRTEVIEHQRAEESLRLLGAAVEQATDSIMITDADLDLPGPRIVFVNRAFTRMTGYAPDEIVGQTPRLLQGPRTDQSLLRRLRRDLERDGVFEGEAVNYRKDGKEIEVEWQIAPIRDARGVTTHFLAIQREVTGRKRFEAQLLQSQKMETVGRLAGGVAHEFNSLMTVVIGHSELMLASLPPESSLARNADEIHEVAGRAAALTQQLLAFGRKQILRPEVIDLNSVLAAMKPMLLHLAGTGVELRLKTSAGPKAVNADAGQIEQAILNVVINAADAMPDGGILTLETTVETLEGKYVSRVPGLTAGNFVMLAISDTGGGMSEEVRAHLFEPFFTTKGVGEGTGLGLATCFGIVKQSHGHIAVVSEPGRGSTFKIYLPQVEPEAVYLEPSQSSAVLPGFETILLVEDDPALRDMAADFLEELGYKVLRAEDGVEALKLAFQPGLGKIDLLFTDLMMPNLGGKEMTASLREKLPNTKILFTSGYTHDAMIRQGRLDPGVEMLQKPFTPTELAQKVREVLDQGKT